MIDLELVKQHLNIDEEFTADDDYLNRLITVAQQAVTWQIDKALEDSEDEETTEDETANQAMLLLIGELYKNREVTSTLKAESLPKSYDYLIGVTKRYTIA